MTAHLTFGARLRRLRKEKNLTQTALAEQVGCLQARISQLERHDHLRPNAEHAQALAQALGVTVTELMGEPPQFGPRLRALRKAKGLSMKALGARMGCSSTRVRQFEMKQKLPSESRLVALAEALGVSMSELLGETVTGVTMPAPKRVAMEPKRPPLLRQYLADITARLKGFAPLTAIAAFTRRSANK